MALELELKLKVPDKYAAQRLCEDSDILLYAQEPLREMRMEAIYYDTSSHALTQRKWSLRIRREDERLVATFKCNRPGKVEKGLFFRDEWQCEISAGENPLLVAERLVEEGAPRELLEILENAELEERCRIRYLRRLAVLRLPKGLTCEFSLDDGMIYADGKEQEMLEMELEVLYGDEEQAVALCAAWASRYGLTYEYASKYERALRLIRSRGNASAER